jgi:hypothetical protein
MEEIAAVVSKVEAHYSRHSGANVI